MISKTFQQSNWRLSANIFNRRILIHQSSGVSNHIIKRRVVAARPFCAEARKEGVGGTMTSRPPYAMAAHTLRAQGQQTLDALENCLKKLLTGPVRPNLQPGDLAKQFPRTPPAEGKGDRHFEQILADFESKILPGVTNWQHPHFMAFYPSSTSVPAVLGELLCAATASVGLQWQSNPICTELEVVVMDWLATMLHVPSESPFRHTSGKIKFQ